MTRLEVSGLISTRLSRQDVRRLWRLIDGLADAVCVAVSVESPLPWFDAWTARAAQSRSERLQIRFHYPRRIKPGFGGDA
jgi:hypothetical protein